MSIRAQRFGTDAEPLGAELLVSPEEHEYLSGPSLAGDPRGGFVVTWHRPDDIQARGYRPDGSPLAGQFVVNSYTTAFQGYPRVAADGDGNLVIAWSQPRLSGARPGVQQHPGPALRRPLPRRRRER